MNKILGIFLLTTLLSPCLHGEISHSSVPPQSNNILIKNRLIDDGENVLFILDNQNEVDLFVDIIDMDFEQYELIFNDDHHMTSAKQQRYNEFSLLAERNFELEKPTIKEVDEPKPVRSANTFVSESINLNYSPWGWGWGYGAQFGRWPYYPHRWYY